jgi:hypothetical protein
MSEQDHTDWGSPVTFNICHHYACPCSSCAHDTDGTGPPEYSLVITPSHLRSTMKTVPVLRLYEDELESMINVITAALIPSNDSSGEAHRKFGKADKSVSFHLTRNKNGQELGEYRLHLAGRGVDDILPVDKDVLHRLVKDVAEMKEFYETELKRSEERQGRERAVKSLMKDKTLDEIEDEIWAVNPFVAKDEEDRRVVRVLLSAAFFVGADIKRLVHFTGYSRSFIRDISCRMHDSGLWADGEACVEHWFDKDMHWTEFDLVQDCLVADGWMVACRGGEHGTWAYQSSGRGW